jgi:molybdenum cofactor biosynthesis enzyme MoaA
MSLTQGDSRWPEIGVTDWLKIIREQTAGPIFISGGEPFLYQGITKLAVTINRFVRLNTNGTLLNDKILIRLRDQCKKRLLLRVGIQENVYRTHDAAKAVMDLIAPYQTGKMTIQCVILRTGNNGDWTRPLVAYGRKLGLQCPDVEIQQLGAGEFPPKTLDNTDRVLCHRVCIHMFGPDGRRYQCIGKLHQRKDAVEEGTEREGTIVCKDYGMCAFCDHQGSMKIETYEGDREPGIYPYELGERGCE